MLLGFAEQEGRRSGGHTCWVLVAGEVEGADEDLGIWRRRRQ